MGHADSRGIASVSPQPLFLFCLPSLSHCHLYKPLFKVAGAVGTEHLLVNSLLEMCWVKTGLWRPWSLQFGARDLVLASLSSHPSPLSVLLTGTEPSKPDSSISPGKHSLPAPTPHGNMSPQQQDPMNAKWAWSSLINFFYQAECLRHTWGSISIYWTHAWINEWIWGSANKPGSDKPGPPAHCIAQTSTMKSKVNSLFQKSHYAKSKSWKNISWVTQIGSPRSEKQNCFHQNHTKPPSVDCFGASIDL